MRAWFAIWLQTFGGPAGQIVPCYRDGARGEEAVVRVGRRALAHPALLAWSVLRTLGGCALLGVMPV